MRKNIITSLILFLLIGLATESVAQKRRYGYNKKKNKSKKYSSYSGSSKRSSGYGVQKNYWTAGLSLNAMNYYGDLSPVSKKLSTDYSLTKIGLGISGSRSLVPGVFARAAYNFGKIEGNDFNSKIIDNDGGSSVGRYSRNLQFQNLIHELSLGFEFDLLTNNSGARGRFPLNAYVFVGVAGIAHSPKAIAPEFDKTGAPLPAAGKLVDLRDIGTEGQHIENSGLSPYGKFALAIPVGFGIKYKLHHNFDFNFEFGFRKLFTDYLDDVSGKYVDLSLFDNELARAMTERGSETVNAMTGEDRNTDYYSVQSTGNYAHGDDFIPGANRGGSKSNDFYIVSQFRLVYIIDTKGVSRGKFR